MKPVEVDLALELNNRQITCAIQSLGKVRKKLRYSELLLHDEPPREERAAVHEWKQRVNNLLCVHEKLDFPTATEVKQDIDERNRAMSEEASLRTEKPWVIPPKSIEKLIKSRENKRFGPCVGFGPKKDGEVIKEVQNYNGVNSIYTSTRPVIRRDYRGSPLEPLTSLPPWIGPSYYNSPDPLLFKAPSTGCQSAFKNTGRMSSSKSSSELRTQKILQRSWSPSFAKHEHSQDGPHYSHVVDCHRPHSRPANPELANPFSRSSARSTIMIKSPVAGNLSPSRVIIGDRSIQGQSPKFENMYSSSSSIQAKVSRIGKDAYKVKDYTMNLLASQVPQAKRFPKESFIVDPEDDMVLDATEFEALDHDKGEDSPRSQDGDEHRDDMTTETKDTMNSTLDRGSTFNSSVFRVSDIESAITDLMEVYGINHAEISANAVSHKDSLSISAREEKLAKRFIDYVHLYRGRQRNRTQRSIAITATNPPLCDDITPSLEKWYVEQKIYTPAKPQTTKFLKEHKSSEPVNVNGVLLSDSENANSEKQIQEMIQELNIPDSYFALPLDKLQDAEVPVPISHHSFHAPNSLPPVKTQPTQVITTAIILPRKDPLPKTPIKIPQTDRNEGDSPL